MIMKNRITAMAAFGFTLGLLAPLAANADVKMEHFTHFGGVLGMGASDINTTEYLQGLKMREESDIKFTGAVLGALQRLTSHGSKGSQSVSILRVDENKRYSLKTDKLTYSVSPLYQPEKKQEDSSGEAKDKEDNDTKITKNEFTVKDTGKKKAINGWDCREYIITWNVETENTKTHEKGKSVMTSDLWNASDAKLQKARDEQLAYSKAYLKLMHLPTNPDELKQFGFGTATISGADSKAFFDKLHTVKGYPVSIDVTWEASSTKGKDDSAQSDSQDDKDAVKALGNLFGSKSDDSKPANDDGMTTVFTSHTELKSVDTGSLDKGLFEVPAGYTQD